MIFFVVRVLIIYLTWKFLIWFLGEERIPIEQRHWPWLSAGWEKFNDYVKIAMLHATKYVLVLLGYTDTIISKERVLVPDVAWVGIGNYCLGIQLWLFVVALIWSYPGKWQRKLIYSILGVIGINILNVIRFVSLIFVFHAYPESISFNHDYVFNVIVYILTFLFWVIYVKRGTKKLKLSEI